MLYMTLFLVIINFGSVRTCRCFLSVKFPYTGKALRKHRQEDYRTDYIQFSKHLSDNVSSTCVRTVKEAKLYITLHTDKH